MRVYEAIVKGLQFVGVDAWFGGASDATNLLALKHSSKIKCAIRQRKPVILSIGFGAIRINHYSPVAPLPGIDRDLVTSVERVYPLVIILAMFFAWGVSHA